MASSQPHNIIDLTLSDDEKDLGEFSTANVAFQFDGLPRFDFSTVPAKVARPPPILPPARPQTQIQSQSQSQTRLASSAQINVSLPPAKRRKTETPPAVRTTVPNATRILPPKPAYQTASRPLKSSHPKIPTSTRLSPSGRIQKTTANAKHEGQVVKQVIDLLKVQLAKQPVKLSASARDSLLTKALQELLDPSVYHESTTGILSSDFVKALQEKARFQVARLIQHADRDTHDAYDTDSSYERKPSEDTFDSFRASSESTTSIERDNEPYIKPRLVVRLPIAPRTEINKPRARETWAVAHPPGDKYFERPYLNQSARDALRLGVEASELFGTAQIRDLARGVCHVDFVVAEVKVLYVLVLNAQGGKEILRTNNCSLPSLLRKLHTLLRTENEGFISKVCRDLKKLLASNSDFTADHGIGLLKTRDQSAVRSFLQDATRGSCSAVDPRILQVDVQASTRKQGINRRVSHLLLQRELASVDPVRAGRASFYEEILGMQENRVVRQSEWTGCCGDITAITWTSNNAFVCGATAHSDPHNMQYNKPGNFVVGCAAQDSLRSIPNHRIVRPQVSQEENAENALESMRSTQDPWLYTSVVSTAHCKQLGLTFSGSFDKTVKIWRVPDDNSNDLQLHGAWYHPANVNFVVSSEHHTMIATACDIKTDAVRVYALGGDDVNLSSYVEFCGNRTQGQGQGETWAYFPATIQWGRAPNVSHLLLVGYSPRSLTGHDQDIPEDRRNTGELCLWNAEDSSRVLISSSSMQNVFEVIWHPTQPIFLAATSPSGNYESYKTKTQIRVFAQNDLGVFMTLQTLDCPALDINELTILPNSRIHSYITASCTDGNTYVYDSAQGDQPLHILRHGESVDNPLHELSREEADTGVKFAAWGRCKTRLFTGGSDGKVKLWDVTAPPGQAFVRDVLIASAGISCGLFSEDKSKLLIGDASGKVHLLSPDDRYLEAKKSSRQKVQTRHLPAALRRKPPKSVIPHPEPAPPSGSAIPEQEKSGRELAREMIRDGKIQIHPNRAIGAVQGWNYTSKHVEDSQVPVPLVWENKQSELLAHSQQRCEFQSLSPLGDRATDQLQHKNNLELDSLFSNLSLEAMQKSVAREDQLELDWDTFHQFTYESGPGKKFALFKESGEERRLRKL